MILTCTSHVLQPRRVFRISRGSRKEARNIFVRLEHQGLAGYGEAAPISFYRETCDEVMAKIEGARDFLATLVVRSVADIEAAWEALWPIVAPSRAAQCALDLALWDWLAWQKGVTVCELAWAQASQPITTFCTVGLSDAEELADKIVELRGFPRIKVKSDQSAHLDAVRRIRAEFPEAMLAVDANCAWSGANLSALAHELSEMGVAFIEQPLPPEEAARFYLNGATHPPIVADESCVTEADVERVAEHFDGFNIKLVKCGGLTPARRMAQRGHELGLKVMVGCMLESSALISAGAVIAQRADYADLDGAWLIGNDPFSGWSFEHGTLLPPRDCGLGIWPESGLF